MNLWFIVILAIVVLLSLKNILFTSLALWLLLFTAIYIGIQKQNSHKFSYTLLLGLSLGIIAMVFIYVYRINMWEKKLTEGLNDNKTIIIKDMQYNPSEISVNAGETVTWINEDPVNHTVTSGQPGAENGLFDSGELIQGEEFSHTFENSGSYDYFCIPHPWMTGTIETN